MARLNRANQIDGKVDAENGRAGKRLVLREAMKQSKGRRSTGHRQRQSPKLVADMTTQKGQRNERHRP